jgi:protein-S-isoprenylcysteine O-methyltransferase Ste14
MSSQFIERGGGWVLAQSVLMLAVLATGPLTRGLDRPAWAWAAAGGLLAAGAVTGLAGAAVLGRNRTIFPRPTAGSALVQRGIYAHIRHPLYTSVMCLGFAWALGWWSWPTGALAVGLTALLAAKARREEVWLATYFPGYAEYARRVPRFVPRW